LEEKETSVREAEETMSMPDTAEDAPRPVLAPEEPYRPPDAPHETPQWVFRALACLMLLVFLILGRMYYRSSVLPDKLYRSASDHFEKEEYEEAAREYEMAEELRSGKAGGGPPESDDVLYRRAYAYERLGRHEDAAAAYALYLGKRSDDMRAVESLGKIYYSLGRSEDALPRLERLAEAVSADAELLLALGRLYEWRGDDARAADAYSSFVESDSSDAEALLEIGRVLMRSGRYADALAGFAKADDLLPSDDKRGYHAVSAAKNMLGWPTDERMIVTPGMSIGNMRLGLTRIEALEAWGDPLCQIDEGGYSVWGYNGTIERPETVVFFDEYSVIEIATESKRHMTSDGLGLANFREVKYRDRFLRARDEVIDPPIYRYILREGGLAFYAGDPASADMTRAVIYAGARPMTERLDARWGYYLD
jgi:tetratricopeptide (TPR) repeat protein